ncbi:hypothetical protein AAG570_003625 [Ranatra chinensis]|uniref:Uncharacterized protein n=1 Tax=Ranatra chinensis TaxID=642074 RepID=A0ABD0Y495_9HEMI
MLTKRPPQHTAVENHLTATNSVRHPMVQNPPGDDSIFEDGVTLLQDQITKSSTLGWIEEDMEDTMGILCRFGRTSQEECVRDQGLYQGFWTGKILSISNFLAVGHNFGSSLPYICLPLQSEFNRVHFDVEEPFPRSWTSFCNSPTVTTEEDLEDPVEERSSATDYELKTIVAASVLAFVCIYTATAVLLVLVVRLQFVRSVLRLRQYLANKDENK